MKDFGGIKSAGLLIKKQSARYLNNKFMEMVFLVIVVMHLDPLSDQPIYKLF
jgi:hypothetical protein